MSLAGMSTLWLSRRASHSLSGNLWIALSETKCAPTARFAALKQAGVRTSKSRSTKRPNSDCGRACQALTRQPRRVGRWRSRIELGLRRLQRRPKRAAVDGSGTRRWR